MSGIGSYLSPEDQEQLSAIQRRQAYAQALLQQGQDSGRGAYGGLKSAGSAILGAVLANRADKSEKALTQGAASKYQQDLGSFLSGTQPQAAPAPASGIQPPPQGAPQTPETQISNNPGSGPVLASPAGATPPATPPSAPVQPTAQAQPPQAPQTGQGAPDPLAALVATHNPVLMQQFGPTLLQNQLNRGNKLWENSLPISQADKDQAALSLQNQEAGAKFTNQLPMTAGQQAQNKLGYAQLNKPVSVGFGDTLVSPQSGKVIYGGGNTGGQIATGPDGQPISGDAYLKTLPPNLQSTVKAIATYRQAPLTGMAMRSPYGAQLASAVNQYNPQYDATQYGSKVKARNDFTTGKNGNTVRSLNVAVQHLDQLGQLSDALGNGNIQIANQIGNAFNTQFGASQANNFNAAKQIVGDEIVKAIVGAGGGVGDRDKAAATINAASSPQQLKGVIQTYQGLMAGQLGGLKQQYEKSTGLGDFEDYLAPETKEKLQAHAQVQPSGQPNAPKVIRYDAQGNRVAQ